MKTFSAAKVPLIGSISGADTLRSPVNRAAFPLHVPAEPYQQWPA
jgi:hypothetical protein